MQGQILRAYGEQPSGARNDGLDIAAAEGSPVRAVEGGVVSYAGSDLPGYGNMLMITHADGLTSVYAHNGSCWSPWAPTSAAASRSPPSAARARWSRRSSTFSFAPATARSIPSAISSAGHRGGELGSSAGRPDRRKVIGMWLRLPLSRTPGSSTASRCHSAAIAPTTMLSRWRCSPVA